MSPFDLIGAVLIAILVGSGALFLMLVIGGFVVRLFGTDASRSEAELQSTLNKGFRPTRSQTTSP